MSLICSYQNCLSVKYPCGSTAFFRLPSDSRRSVWIRNSGNKALQNISDRAHRFFCENHFRECDIRTQFNRKILRKHAVPIEHASIKGADYSEPSLCDEFTDSEENKKQETNLIIEKLDDFLYAADVTNDIHRIQQTTEFGNEDERLQSTHTLQEFYSALERDNATEKSNEQSSRSSDVYHDGVEDNEIHSYEEICDIKMEPASISPVYDSDFNQSTEEEDEIVNVEIPVKRRKTDEISNRKNLKAISTPDTDYQEDKHFALSLVGYFQRLPKDKKALAKLRILQYLTELDIGLDSTL